MSLSSEYRSFRVRNWLYRILENRYLSSFFRITKGYGGVVILFLLLSVFLVLFIGSIALHRNMGVILPASDLVLHDSVPSIFVLPSRRLLVDVTRAPCLSDVENQYKAVQKRFLSSKWVRVKVTRRTEDMIFGVIWLDGDLLGKILHQSGKTRGFNEPPEKCQLQDEGS